MRKKLGVKINKKDSRGFEIREGDVCIFNEPNIKNPRHLIKMVVTWEKDVNCWFLALENNYRCGCFNLTNMIVIGSIYKNPKWLKFNGTELK